MDVETEIVTCFLLKQWILVNMNHHNMAYNLNMISLTQKTRIIIVEAFTSTFLTIPFCCPTHNHRAQIN